jgi:hypothetical protein
VPQPFRSWRSCGRRRPTPPSMRAGGALAPSKHGNRSPRTQGPSPARARPAPTGCSPEFGRTAAGRRPGVPLRSHKSF